MADTAGRLPEVVVILLTVAAAILWILFLLMLLAVAMTPIERFGDVVPALGVWDSDPSLGMAMMFQTGSIGLALLICWVMSTWVVVAHFMGQTARAVFAAVILVRLFMAMSVLSFLSGLAVPAAMSAISALPYAAASLPQLLIQLAVLFCADRFLTSRTAAEVF